MDWTKVEEIIQHIQNPKKLTLPKGYKKSQHKNNELIDMEDCLDYEVASTVTSVANSFTAHNKMQQQKDSNTNVNNNQNVDIKVVEKTVKAKKEKSEKKARPPTAYNVFVKETMLKLQETHNELSGRERFNLAIKMWNDQKKVKTT